MELLKMVVHVKKFVKAVCTHPAYLPSRDVAAFFLLSIPPRSQRVTLIFITFGLDLR